MTLSGRFKATVCLPWICGLCIWRTRHRRCSTVTQVLSGPFRDHRTDCSSVVFIQWASETFLSAPQVSQWLETGFNPQGRAEVIGIKAAPGFTFLLHLPVTMTSTRFLFLVSVSRGRVDQRCSFSQPSRNVTDDGDRAERNHWGLDGVKFIYQHQCRLLCAGCTEPGLSWGDLWLS